MITKDQMKPKVKKVAFLPNCQICNGESIGVLNSNIQTPAAYDACTKSGQWGYVCERHFKSACLKWGAFKLELKKEPEVL